ncbi:hypothetical protein HK101_008355 [Irineochytrium annulatum]|nr:hypothetical protein HK101_008355 [Irineochytrium annulatum]
MYRQSVALNATYHPAVRSLEMIYDFRSALDLPHLLSDAQGLIDAGVAGAVGAGFSGLTVYFSAYLNQHKIPVCDGSATSPTLSNKVLLKQCGGCSNVLDSQINYPNFFRTVAPDNLAGSAILDFIISQGWKHMSIIASDDPYGQGIADLLTASAVQKNMQLMSRSNFVVGDSDFTAHINAIKTAQSTIIVFAGLTSDFANLVKQGGPLGLFDAGYGWITTDGVYGEQSLRNLLTDKEAQFAQGALNFYPIEGTGPVYDKFLQNWRASNITDPYVTLDMPGTYTMFVLNCVELYVNAFDAIIKAHPEVIPSVGQPWNLSSYIKVPDTFMLPNMPSETGPIILDSNGDRLGSYSMSFFNATLGFWQPFGTYDSINRANITSEIRYSGNTPQKPKDTIVSCPIGYGMYATSQGTGCVFCPKGTYNVLGSNSGPCFDCPYDATCMGGSSVSVNTGYWLTTFAADASANVSIEVHKCPYPLLCCPEGNCTFGGLCADGFQGPLCADCAKDDAYFWGDQCVACSSSLGMSFWVMMFGTLVGAVVVLLIPADETPTIELLFLYFQVVGYIFESDLGGAIGIGGLNRFFAVISLNFDGMVSDCPVPLRGLGKLMFRFVMPLMLLVYVSLIYVVVRFTQSRVSGAAAVMERFTPPYLKNQSISMICLRAIITTLTFAIMPLTEAALSM